MWLQKKLWTNFEIAEIDKMRCTTHFEWGCYCATWKWYRYMRLLVALWYIKKVYSPPPDIEPKHTTATKNQLLVKTPSLQAKKNWTRTAIIPCTCPRYQMMVKLTERIHDERLLQDLRISDMRNALKISIWISYLSRSLTKGIRYISEFNKSYALTPIRRSQIIRVT